MKETETSEFLVEYRKGTKWNQSPDYTYRYMECKSCGQMETVSESATSSVCWECVMEDSEKPEITTRGTEGKVSGWHFMKEFVDKNGNVYHKGIEQTHLKGTLEPSVIEKKDKLSKDDKEKYKLEAAKQVARLKKELSNLRLKKDIKEVTQKINQYTKIMKGKFPELLVAKLFS